MEDSAATERRRSSRISGSGNKRKRAYNEAEETGFRATKPKMPKNENTGTSTSVNFTFDDMKKFMHGEFRTAINEDIEKNNKKLSDRIDSTQAELRTHKAHVEKEMERMRQELSARAEVPAVPAVPSLPPPGTYAACLLYTSPSPRDS